MILSENEVEFIYSDEATELINDYVKRHHEAPPPYNWDEFSSLEEWIELLKS